MEILISKTEKFVIELFNNKLDNKFVFHNLAHTQQVVDNVHQLVELSAIENREKNILLLSAWLHDTGYTVSSKNHEMESVKIAKAFLLDNNCNASDIDAVLELIMATKINHHPNNDNEKIICDADCGHIASKNYIQIAELLRKEWEFTCNKTLTELEWLEENINFLAIEHQFYSNEASQIWEKGKRRNLSELLKTQNKLKRENSKLNYKKEELSFKKNKIELPERGIETMFRVALRNHITLSDIADTKANILLSVNAIIISLVLSNLVSKLDNPSNDYLIWPTVIFTGFTVVSIILSILATRPNVTQGKFSKQDVAAKKVNLLFFGNFHKMELNEFEWAMGEMMQDRDYLYGSLTKDLYFLGLVLNRKYKLLRLTYSVFMVGIVVSVLSFAVAFHYS